MDARRRGQQELSGFFDRMLGFAAYAVAAAFFTLGIRSGEGVLVSVLCAAAAGVLVYVWAILFFVLGAILSGFFAARHPKPWVRGRKNARLAPQARHDVPAKSPAR